MKLMIATPAYNGKVDIPYALSYANTCVLLAANNIQITPLIVTSGSLLVAERNKIIQTFYESDCTHLLCIDSDLGWPAEAVIAMLKQEKDIVAGVYPARTNMSTENEYLCRPYLNPDNTVITENHLIKMEYIPAGFMLISKNCIQKLRDKFPERYYEPKNDAIGNPSKGFCFFNTEIYDGEFWGEDFVFCRLLKEAGIDIWVDPLIQFDHAGRLGMLLEILSTDKTKKIPPTLNVF